MHKIMEITKLRTHKIQKFKNCEISIYFNLSASSKHTKSRTKLIGPLPVLIERIAMSRGMIPELGRPLNGTRGALPLSIVLLQNALKLVHRNGRFMTLRVPPVPTLTAL